MISLHKVDLMENPIETPSRFTEYTKFGPWRSISGKNSYESIFGVTHFRYSFAIKDFAPHQ